VHRHASHTPNLNTTASYDPRNAPPPTLDTNKKSYLACRLVPSAGCSGVRKCPKSIAFRYILTSALGGVRGYYPHSGPVIGAIRSVDCVSKKVTSVWQFARLPHRNGNSDATWDHTVLPATRQRRHSRPYPSRSWYSIKRPRRDARLS